MPTSKPRVSVVLPTPVANELRERAEQMDVTQSWLVKQAVREKLERMREDKIKGSTDE